MVIVRITKIFTRPMQLAVAEAWSEGVELIAQKFRVAPRHLILYGQLGYLESYRSMAEMRRVQQGIFLVAKRTPQRITDLLQGYIRTYRRLQRVLEAARKTGDKKRLADLLSVFARPYAGAFVGMFVSLWLPDFLDRKRLAGRYGRMHRFASTVRRRYGDWGGIGVAFYDRLSSVVKAREPRASLYTNAELTELLKNGTRVTAPIIASRARGYWFYRARLRTATSMMLLKRQLRTRGMQLVEVSAKTKETLRGSVAFPGTARGTVTIVRTSADAVRVRRGSILVSPMTYPTFLSAMHRAAAYVTDEGGMLCHAAIVARELKKPCIIGAKIATKALKDGDLVEVDAEKGVVRILKKA